jgi:orotate phosphoribosyltransferase
MTDLDATLSRDPEPLACAGSLTDTAVRSGKRDDDMPMNDDIASTGHAASAGESERVNTNGAEVVGWVRTVDRKYRASDGASAAAAKTPVAGT